MTAERTYLTLTTNSERWNRFEFRPGDVVISTPPKTGTTLTQMLTALLIFDDPTLPAPLNELSPWLDMTALIEAEVFATLAAQTHRRFIKTHAPLDGIPDRDDIVYLTIARDPRDVFVSYQHHFANLDMDKMVAAIDASIGLDRAAHLRSEPIEDLGERFERFLDPDDTQNLNSLVSLLHQFRLQWDRRDQPNVCAQHFHDVRNDRVTAMQRIAATLGLERSVERLETLAEAASLDSMRKNSSDRAPATGFFTDTNKFFRTGGQGEWDDIATPDQLARYWTFVNETVSPELGDWIHTGSADR